MNKIEWVGIIGIIIVVLIMSGCAGYDIVWDRGQAYKPVVIAGTCPGPTTDWPCMEEWGCFVIG
jgi:hypothetical protein